MTRVRRYHASGAVDEEVDPTDVSESLGDHGALLPPTRGSCFGYRRVVSPLRNAINLLRNEVGFLGEAAVLHRRDVYDHVLQTDCRRHDLLTAPWTPTCRWSPTG